MLKYLLVCCFIIYCQALAYYPVKLDAEGKIVGGQDVDITQLPFTLSLERNGAVHVCGASIISQSFALTAAHCVDRVPTNSLKLRAGTSAINNGGSTHAVVSYTVHPLYNATTYDYDIAILEVSEKFSYDNSRQPINIPSKEVTEGSLATISGWGSTEEEGDDSVQLQAVTIPVVNREVCAANYKDEGREVTERMICAGTLGKNFCGTDGGGPIVVGGTQYGIASWAVGCGRQDLYGVYTNVANPEIRLWIFSIAGI